MAGTDGKCQGEKSSHVGEISHAIWKGNSTNDNRQPRKIGKS